MAYRKEAPGTFGACRGRSLPGCSLSLEASDQTPELGHLLSMWSVGKQLNVSLPHICKTGCPRIQWLHPLHAHYTGRYMAQSELAVCSCLGTGSYVAQAGLK